MSQQSPQPKKSISPIDALKRVFSETQSARSAAEKLQPLLSLLDDPESQDGNSSIEQLQEVLETLLLGQRQLHLAMEDLHAKIDALGSKRPVSGMR